MNADRRAEIIQAVEWHDRDLLTEIQRLESRIAELEAELNQDQDGVRCPNCDRMLIKLMDVEAERDRLQKSYSVLDLISKHCRYDAYHQVYMINEIDLDADDKYGLAKATLRREESDGRDR